MDNLYGDEGKGVLIFDTEDRWNVTITGVAWHMFG